MEEQLFIVNYRRNADCPTCTNIVYADDLDEVKDHYDYCEWLCINDSPSASEIEELKRRGCPVVDCGTKVFASKDDVIDYEIMPALGKWADDYDIDAIYHACYTYSSEYGGIVRTVGTSGFWDAVHDADISSCAD